MIKSIDKVVRIGTSKTHNGRRLAPYSVFCRIQFDGKKLSITGVEGPLRNGNAVGSCGQINMYEWNIDAYAPGWSARLETEFRLIWAEWHLNDLQAGCEHQRAEGWSTRPIDPTKPTNTYGKHFAGQRYASWNMLAWVSRAEHPEGLLGVPCSTCGYKYGTAWLTKDVPTHVIEFLSNLPASDETPAWV